MILKLVKGFCNTAFCFLSFTVVTVVILFFGFVYSRQDKTKKKVLQPSETGCSTVRLLIFTFYISLSSQHKTTTITKIIAFTISSHILYSHQHFMRCSYVIPGIQIVDS